MGQKFIGVKIYMDFTVKTGRFHPVDTTNPRNDKPWPHQGICYMRQS
jgi:hypothetical protein